MSGQLPNINKTNARHRILVAPLDWGLGHATRCIPLIRHLQQAGAEIVLAGEGPVADLLSAEFPGLTLLPLPGYRVRYAHNPRKFNLALFLQLPRILRAIRYEHRWLQRQQRALPFDGIISDNRYGIRLRGIPSVIITHQLSIETGSHWLNRLAAKVNIRFLSHFDACWVPDEPGEHNLAGHLSRFIQPAPIPVEYLGPLSRLSEKVNGSACRLLVLISGPEPQRTIFEQEVIQWLISNPGEAVVILGKPGSVDALPLVSGVRFFHHLPASSLNELIHGADLILARCGYSTVMDLALLQKKAVLIPTPGQKEQEYLARHLAGKKLFSCISQNELKQHRYQDLKMMTEKNLRWTGRRHAGPVLDQWLSGL